ncbi:MAG: 50S ribosomal protein L10 [Planctomycetota bacterium]|jgi:large subunit ribosomal protein L10|nr:50S ribosomal protein L10 [Planctomycetota bacterium]
MPSLINELVLNDIKQTVDSAPALILIDPTGLKAEESLILRKQLSEAGASMRQAKARLIAKAVPEDLGKNFEPKGSLAIVAGEDIAAAAKVLSGLVKDEKVAVRAGLIEGRAVDAAAAARFADLPTKHEARALVVRALRAPYVKLAKIAKAPYRKMARAIVAHKEKLEDG